MIEITLVPTTQVGKPKIAIVIGSHIIAEPDARRGVWWDEKSTHPMYAIIDKRDYDKFVDLIKWMNYNTTQPLPIDDLITLMPKIVWFNFMPKILDYMKIDLNHPVERPKE